ncbi:MAG: glucose-6-phosphate dehydrogenase, partial [Acidobacteriia bacterium]|nr:glucose-6-phosphate dehydrogenase [Terriglobia bacterium]
MSVVAHQVKPKKHNVPAAPKPAGPCVLVIFGITGDLTGRLLFPALYNLAHDHFVPDQIAIVGFALGDESEQQLRDSLAQNLRTTFGQQVDNDLVNRLTSRVRFIPSDFDSAEGWQRLKQVLAELDKKYQTGGNYLYYLATAPQFFLPVVQRLSREGLFNQGPGQWRRVIIEKPFGHDLESARQLSREILKCVRQDQVYLIDHYLGKETVQNIMVFRFANGIFEPIWNRRYVDHVQITVAESLGVEHRGRYYDKTGALRDMIPNHLSQLLALTAMEPPSSFSATALQNEQVKVLESVSPIDPEDCHWCAVRGQYTQGTIDDKPVPGYTEEEFVDSHSHTETYVALKFMVDTWRWAGVPFYLRTGKRMRRRYTEIAIRFRNPPLTLFRRSGATLPQPNHLVIAIQPQENICLEFEGKVPGPVLETCMVNMHFDYRDYFGVTTRTGYETLLYDAMIGDASLFKRADMIEAGWAIV